MKKTLIVLFAADFVGLPGDLCRFVLNGLERVGESGARDISFSASSSSSSSFGGTWFSSAAVAPFVEVEEFGGTCRTDSVGEDSPVFCALLASAAAAAAAARARLPVPFSDMLDVFDEMMMLCQNRLNSQIRREIYEYRFAEKNPLNRTRVLMRVKNNANSLNDPS